MGICETRNNEKITANSTSNGQLASNNLANQKSLVLNNDVIVSDTNQEIETIYEKIKKLGEGSFGEVWLVRHKILGKEFAMKIIQKSPDSNINQIKNEIEILKQLDHPNILKILDFHLTNDKFYIITDFCSEGELYHEIKKRLLEVLVNKVRLALRLVSSGGFG